MKEKMDLKYLLEKYSTNTCTKEEFDQLLEFIEQDHGVGLTEELHQYWQKAAGETKQVADWKERASSLLDEARMQSAVTGQTRNKRKTRLAWGASVAAMLISVAAGYFAFNKMDRSQLQKRPVPSVVASKDEEVVAGGKKAVLTLADGSVIKLDSAKNGTVATQGNTRIIKVGDGEILYYMDRQSATTSGFNTISTPRGGRYTVVLSDGTKVWLNAASSLKFPISFVDNTRDVTLTGEGYFEVAKDAGIPFHVRANYINVEVLGTHFNINSYSDESSVATTLLEGSVKVKPPTATNTRVQTALLKPGDQAKITSDGKLKINPHANTQAVVAWKNNNFEFENTPIPIIMRQISRWYDVEVEYRGVTPKQRLTGKFSRNVTLNQLIGMLKYTGLNMKIENRKIIVW